LISIATPATRPTAIQGAQRCGSARSARMSIHSAAAVISRLGIPAFKVLKQ